MTAFLDKLIILFRHCQALLLNHAPCRINFLSPLALVVEIIKQMNPSKLALPPKVPHAQCATPPPEDWYGKEFYSASGQILNGGVLWSPEFGIKGVKGGGAIDFYLESNKWGVEITRDGDQLSSHYGRFQPGGSYHRWILDGTLADWVLLDFRSTIPINKHLGKDKPSLLYFDSTTLTMILHRISQPISRLFLKRIFSSKGLGPQPRYASRVCASEILIP